MMVLVVMVTPDNISLKAIKKMKNLESESKRFHNSQKTFEKVARSISKIGESPVKPILNPN